MAHKGLTKAGTPRKRAPGAGRKPVAAEDHSVRQIVCRLFAEDDADLTFLCNALDAPESEVVRRAIRDLAAKLRRRKK